MTSELEFAKRLLDMLLNVVENFSHNNNLSLPAQIETLKAAFLGMAQAAGLSEQDIVDLVRGEKTLIQDGGVYVPSSPN